MLKYSTKILQRFGRRLKELRLQRGMTQSQLGERCGLTARYVSEMERGLRNPSLATLYRITHEGLETSLAVLFFRIDEISADRMSSMSSRQYQSPDLERNQGTSRGERNTSLASEPSVPGYQELMDSVLAGRTDPERIRLITIFREIAGLLDDFSEGNAPVKIKRIRPSK